MGARVCITCMRLCFLHQLSSVVWVNCVAERETAVSCLLFCLVEWVCCVKLSSVVDRHTDVLGSAVGNSLKHTAIDAAAPLDNRIKLDLHTGME